MSKSDTSLEHFYKAIRYYEGDVRGTDPFWSDAKAYVTLNSLFFPGLATEEKRSAEGKRLNSAFFDDPARLLDLCRTLLEACLAFSCKEPRVLYRVERLYDFSVCREYGRTLSFTSTSTAGFLDAYRDRKGIALLRFELPTLCPCIPMAAVLSKYEKAEEAEVTLPPFLPLTFKEVPLSDEEMKITDSDGCPPAISCLVSINPPPAVRLPGSSRGVKPAHFLRPAVPGAPGISDAGPSGDLCDDDLIFRPEDADGGRTAFAAWNQKRQPDPAAAARYLRWKKTFILHIVKMINELQNK